MNASDGLIHWWYATIVGGTWLTIHNYHFRLPNNPPLETDAPMNCLACLKAGLGTAQKTTRRLSRERPRDEHDR